MQLALTKPNKHAAFVSSANGSSKNQQNENSNRYEAYARFPALAANAFFLCIVIGSFRAPTTGRRGNER